MMSSSRANRYKYSTSRATDRLGSDKAEVINPSTQRGERFSAVSGQDEPINAVIGPDLWSTEKVKAKGFSVSSDLKEIPPDAVQRDITSGREDELQVKDTNESSVGGRRVMQDTPEESSRAVNAGDAISKQVDIRRDVVALGFVSFEQKFDHSRILCIYGNDQHSVSFVFFHAQGMATVFGVGLPFSALKLNAESAVEIQEEDESIWKEHWTKQGMEDFSQVMLFDSSNLFSENASSALTSQVSRLSNQNSAKLFGIDATTNATVEFQAHSNEDAVPLAWLRLLHEFTSGTRQYEINVRTQTSESEITEDGTYGKNTGSESSSSDTFYSAERSISNTSNSRIYDWLQHNPLFEGKSGNQGVDTKAESNDDTSKQQQDLQLTVKVHLNPVRYSLYSPSYRTEVRTRPVSGSREIEVIYPPTQSDHDPQGTETVQMSDYQMASEVTIKFTYEAVGKANRRKRLTTTLKADFNMDGSIINEEYFGWYHDELKLSLECKEQNAVRRNTIDFGKEILSEHRVSKAQRGRVEENQCKTSRSQHQGVKVNTGFFGIASLSASLKRGKRAENILKNHAADYTELEITCLSGSNFSVTKNELNAQELAYRACIFPPISYTDLWHQGQRELARASAVVLSAPGGIMSTVPFEIQGQWTVKTPDDAWTDCTLFEYVFKCQRDLIRYQKSTAIAPKPSVLCFRPSKEVKRLEKIVLEQTLSKCFLVNHSFSHMSIQRLRRPEAYEWDLASQNSSPVMALLQCK